MIVVRIELWSARTGVRTELARMHIENDGTGIASHGHYDGSTFVGRSSASLDRMTVSHRGRVENYARQRRHVWQLVAQMLISMGYA